MDENAIINSDMNGKLHYLISIKSLDNRFNFDGYKFIIPNREKFGHFKELREIGKKVDIDSLKYLSYKNLESFDNCKLHNFLSLKENIFLVVKHSKRNPIDGKTIISYWMYPIIYEGTEKNIEMMKQGF